MVKMISMDTSTTCTGVAIWKNAKLSKHFCIRTDKKSETKADDMIEKIVALIRKENPQIIICEGLNVVNNVAVAKNLAKIIGAIKGVCEFNDMFYDVLAPSQWRKLVCDGNMPPKKREDLKPWDIDRVKTLFKFMPENDDEADAVLIGEAYRRLIDTQGEETAY